MQRTSVTRHMNLIAIVLTAMLAIASYSVLTAVRARMLAGGTTLKKAAGTYSELRKTYSQATDETDAPTHVSLETETGNR
jgi:hypothetical protein